LPGALEVLTTIDQNDCHIICCDVCNFDVTLTVTAHPQSFLKHRCGAACLRLWGSQGFADLEPVVQPIPDLRSTLLPKIPGMIMVDMFISLKEENLLKIAEAATMENGQAYTLPGSDEIESLKEDLK
jgi:hypothetical protein